MSLDHLLFCATGTLRGALEVIFIGWYMFGKTVTTAAWRFLALSSLLLFVNGSL